MSFFVIAVLIGVLLALSPGRISLRASSAAGVCATWFSQLMNSEQSLAQGIHAAIFALLLIASGIFPRLTTRYFIGAVHR